MKIPALGLSIALVTINVSVGPLAQARGQVPEKTVTIRSRLDSLKRKVKYRVQQAMLSAKEKFDAATGR